MNDKTEDKKLKIERKKDKYDNEICIINGKSFEQFGFKTLFFEIKDIEVVHKIFDHAKFCIEPNFSVIGKAVLNNSKGMGVAGTDFISSLLDFRIKIVDKTEFEPLDLHHKDYREEAIGNAIVTQHISEDVYGEERCKSFITLLLTQDEASLLYRVISEKAIRRLSLEVEFYGLYRSVEARHHDVITIHDRLEPTAYMIPDEDKNIDNAIGNILGLSCMELPGNTPLRDELFEKQLNSN